MKQSLLVLFAVAVFWTSLSAVQAESGLVITFPQTLQLNSTAKVCFTSVNITGGMMILARLQYDTGMCFPVESNIWSSHERRDGCVEFSTDCPYYASMHRFDPPSSGNLAVLLSGITGTEAIQKTYRKRVIVAPLKTETFIQSDKPIYQPGQKVLFRVLTVNYPEMLPDIENTKDVWITSPGGTRMQQWRDQVSSDGLLDLTFVLSGEPELGEWMIHVQVHGGLKTTQTFSVEEYVLPKFEVLIKPPSYLYRGDGGPFTVRICAKYTYGQPVSGHIAANISVLDPNPHVWWRIRPTPTVIPLEVEADDITGCGDIILRADRLFSSSDNVDGLKLKVMANFTERGTGITLSGLSTSTSLERNPIKMEIRGPGVFKPFLRYHGQVVVTNPDGTPAGVKRVKVSWPYYPPQLLQTGPDGTVDFVLGTPHLASTTTLSITAKLLDEPDTTDTPSANVRSRLSELGPVIKQVKAWYSPSGSFLQISDIKEKVSVSQPVPVQLEFTLPKNETQIEFFYRVVSRGGILASGNYHWTQDDGQSTGQGELLNAALSELVSQIAVSTSASSRSRQQQRLRVSDIHFCSRCGLSEEISPELPNYATNGTKAQAIFYFDAVAEMSPKSQLLVYYIRDDGEVVSASTDFKMASAFKNQVSVEFLEGREIKPGQTASISLHGQPSSLCALSVVDKSVHIMGGNNQLSKEKVLDPMSSLNVIPGSPAVNCPTRRRSPFFSKHLDSLEGFRTAGVGVLTDLKVETRPCWERRHFPCCDRASMDYSSFGLPGYPTAMRLPSAFVPVFEDLLVAMEVDVDSGVHENVPGIMEVEEAVQLRSYFPETWLWKLQRLGGNGQHVIEEEIPHTITDWVASAFCLSAEHGVGVAEATSIRAFQPFFLSYTIPYSIIQGERAPVKVTIFNYLSSCLNIQLTMTESTAFSIETRPESETIEVCGNSAETLEYEIIPLELGDLPVRVTASAEPSADRGDVPPDDITFPVTDAIEDTILVEPEGAGREETFSELICPHDTDGVYEKTIPLQLPSIIVPESARGRIQVIGDIMGPVMSNLDSLLRMPFGCGEQNMIFMAPNIYVMQYLSSTGQLTPDINDKALKFMNSGYQRELTYQLRDHSYSAFGESDGEGSTWLTAFVLKCFTQAQDFMDVDQEDLDQTRHWLERNDRDENGCVVTRGRVIHKEMQGSVTSPVTMTAFVTIALLEAGASPSNHYVIQGLECIRNSVDSEGDNMDTYTLAISSYALGLGEDYTAQNDALDYLQQRALGEAGLSYWSKSESRDHEDSICHSYCRADSSDVEITAYVLLAYMQQDTDVGDILSHAMPIVKWLNTQRNALGGFSSTQDTVLGLQALSQFANLAYDPDAPLSMNISVNATRAPPNSHQQHSFAIDNYNRLVLQREELEEVPTNLTLAATGSGCALFQAELLYNVPVVQPTHLLFNITTTIREWEGNSIVDPSACGDKTLEICVTYIGSIEETGMAVMEVKMVSGYIPHEQSLNEFQDREGNSIGLKRFDKYKAGQPLSLYFDKFDSEVRCIPINLKQEFFVKEAKDAFIKVYDYYKPDLVGFKSYNTCEADN